jgi:hypothetical protein
LVEAERAVDVRRTAVTTLFRYVEMELIGEGGDLGAEGPRVDAGPSRVKEHQRITGAQLFIPKIVICRRR